MISYIKNEALKKYQIYGTKCYGSEIEIWGLSQRCSIDFFFRRRKKNSDDYWMVASSSPHSQGLSMICHLKQLCKGNVLLLICGRHCTKRGKVDPEERSTGCSIWKRSYSNTWRVLSLKTQTPQCGNYGNLPPLQKIFVKSIYSITF